MTCDRCGTPSSGSACRTCRYIVPALALALLAGCGSGTVTLDTADRDLTPPLADDSGEGAPDPVDAETYADTEVADWMPVISGNWANPLTADACNSPDGPVCYDCYHAPTGTYARWFRVDQDGGYADDDWFGATLGQLVFEDYDEEGGTGLATDGAFYAFDTMAACAPMYWLNE